MLGLPVDGIIWHLRSRKLLGVLWHWFHKITLNTVLRIHSHILLLFSYGLLSYSIFCFDSTGINWKLWTTFQSWLCFHIIVFLHGTVLPRKTTWCCSQNLRDIFQVSIKCLFILNGRHVSSWQLKIIYRVFSFPSWIFDDPLKGIRR